MSTSSGQWIIRIKNEQVKGPHSTETIVKMILNGTFTGQEEICTYPDGEWQPLTKQPEFYNALLESLENPLVVDHKRSQKMEAETVIRTPSPMKRKDADVPPKIQNADELKLFIENQMQNIQQDQQSKIKPPDALSNMPVAKRPPSPPPPTPLNEPSPNQILQERDQNFEIQLKDIQKLKYKELKKLFPGIIIGALALVAVVYLLMTPDEDERSGWQLISIKKSTSEPLSAEEVKSAKRKMVKAFQGGSLEQVLSAQKELVHAVESSPKDLEAFGILCMAYEQLWSYTKQTQEDFKAITLATQLARGVNPISNYSEVCQTVFLLTKGQIKEARSLLEKSLDNQTDEKFSLGAFLYLIKAQILEAEPNYLYAAAYYKQAADLWPAWVTAKFGLARVNYKLNKFAEARDQFSEIYTINKDSRAALLGLGLIELKMSNNVDKAQSYFSNGYDIKEKVPNYFLSEALINYAQILIDKNENKRALQVANEGYRANPGHRGLREMIIALGGSDRAENSVAEMILVGDQFARVGDHMVAQAQYKAAFEVDPKSAIAAYKAAKSLWLINNSRDAISWLDKAISADPKMIQAYVLKADYESQKFNFSEASRTLQRAAKKLSLTHEIIKVQALLEFRKNNMKGAIQYGERAVRIYSADVELLSLLAQAHINYYINGPNVGANAQKQKDESKSLAERYAGRVIDLEPAWPEGQITFAKVLAGVYGAVRAEVYLKDKIKEFPYTSEYRIALAEFYREYEKFPEAAVIYEEVVSVEPKNKKANFGLAETYRILNKPDLAQKYYNLTSVLDPGDVEPMMANAKLLLETASGKEFKAKVEQALTKLSLVKKINPEFPKVSYLMAKSHFDLNDYDNAILLIKEEKIKNPNLADSYILAAEIFFRKGQYKECAAEYAAAIRIRPNSAELYVRSAICYRYSDATDIAEDMLLIAQQKESGYADIYRELGYIFERKNNRSAAILSLEKYLILSPNAPDRTTVESKIKQLGG